ncbi:hypothetical protein E4U11_004917 [Claviceps purpurea]|nr:hypothetical protein E4U11_004917 [Claviceps purpurea]
MAGSPCATPLTVTGSLSSCRLRSNPRATFWVWSRAYGEFDGGQEEGPAGTSGEAQVDSRVPASRTSCLPQCPNISPAEIVRGIEPLARPSTTTDDSMGKRNIPRTYTAGPVGSRGSV